ncbi:MAG: IgGFc-binding protein [Planctomycetes bacterium]|nr:IgGFc-binding protein [Planctomycetota bacterium]
MKSSLLWLSSLSLALSGLAGAQNLDNAGTEFLCGFLTNYSGAVDLELHLTAETATMVTVEYPANSPSFTTTVAVTPGNITTVAVPAGAADLWVSGSVANNLVRASAPVEFTCYEINRQPFTSDAAMALPTDTMNTQFIVADYDPSFNTEFLVYARFDNTTVTITPSNSLQSGQAAGVPFNVVLNANEAFFATGNQTLTGTIIEADRSIGVTNGNRCTQVPLGTSYCDHIFEVAQPVQTWGNDYLVSNLPNRPSGSIYRVLASVDATDVLLDGVSIGMLNRGEFVEVGPLAGDHRFLSTGGEAFFVVQYMTGSSSAGAITGDPAMGNVISSNQYKQSYVFSTLGGMQFAQHFLTIIAANSDVGTLLLDGAAVPAASFTAIAGTGYSVAKIQIQEGTHSTMSTLQGHGITVEGYNTDDSYLFPGGALFDFINPVGDANAPLCSGERFSDRYTGTGQDNRPSEDTNANGILDPGEDLNNNGLIDVDTGVFFVQLAPGSTNLTLNVTPFQAGDGIVQFEVVQTNTAMGSNGAVVIIDGAGNQTQCPTNFGASMGLSVCDPIPNSTGEKAFTTAWGSLLAADNDVTLMTTGLPNNSIGFYFVSQGNGIVSLPGNKVGNLCILGPVMGRHNANMLDSGQTDAVSLVVDLNNLPQPFGGPAVVTSGSTWYWQYWYRDDAMFFGAANFCDAVGVTFQ